MFSFPGPVSIGHHIDPAVHGAGDGNGGGFLMLVESALDTISRALESGSVSNPLAGVEALGTNWHPLIVHFPIAFLTGFFLLELLGVAIRQPTLRTAASWMLYLGAVAAIAAVVAGLIAEDTVPHGRAVHDVMEWHERLGLTIATLSSALAIWRILSRAQFSAMAEALHLFLGGIVLAAIVFAADLGGLMVYQHGVGVKNLQQADDHHHDGHDEHRRVDFDETFHAPDIPHSGEPLHIHGTLHPEEAAHTHGEPHSHGAADAHGKPHADP